MIRTQVAPNKPTQNARSSGHYALHGPQEGGDGSGARCGDVPLGQFRPRAGAVAKRHPVSTAWLATLRQLASLDLIIDVSRGRDHLLGGGGFSTERVPRAAAVVRSVASMTMNECLQARKRPWSCSNCVYTGVRNAFS
jgi:hypothetical protein